MGYDFAMTSFFGERVKQRRLGWGQEQKNDIQTDRRKNNRRYAAERVSHIVASRETVLTVSADIGRLLRFHCRDTLKPVKENKERTDVMNEAKNKNLFIRVSEKEKNIIEHNAKKCGLSVS